MNDKGLQDWLRGKTDPQNGPDRGRLSSAERKELDRYDRLWEAAAPPTLDLDVDADAAWDRIEGRLFGEEDAAIGGGAPSVAPGGAKIVPFRQSLLRIAAAILLLAVAGWWWTNQNSEPALLAYATDTGEREEIELPDGTLVWLNQGSEMTYGEVDGERSIALSGEAFFDVYRDEARPFVITTGALETRVLGTSFNVRAYADKPVEVAVKSGQVAVKDADEAVVLNPTEAVVYEPTTEKLAEPTVDVAKAEAWVKQELNFDTTPLREMIPALERFYGRSFTVENSALLDCELTADFFLEDFPAAVDLLEFQFGTIESTGDEIILRGEGCQ